MKKNDNLKNMNVQTLKGFRDFLGKDARKRQYVIEALKEVFELYGFEPLETPALEYEEILLGKYGEEGDKLMYRFKDLGERNVALRYDQTVPLARVVAQYSSTGELPMPFKRYQIQPVWRAENTQKGRFREFMQCDADTVGVDSALSDAEVIAVSAKAIEKLGFKDYKILVNDRALIPEKVEKRSAQEILDSYDSKSKTFKTSFDIPDEKIGIVWRILDKLEKIERKKVEEELSIFLKIPVEKSGELINEIKKLETTERIKEIFSILEKFGLSESSLKISNTLARGLDYYTGMIFEIKIEGYTAGSVCGGGRYDNLIGMFSNKSVPAVGFAFGFDRLIDAMGQLDLFPNNINETITKVLVTIFSKELKDKSTEIVKELREKNIKTEIYLDENVSLEKQLKYANQKGIPFVVIVGPEEEKNKTVILKNMQTREQKTITKEDLLNNLN